ncbi:RNA-directed DNA polymerase, partial [Aeromicrobium phragmitis]|uniref:RNA-directed DNA polymerase n=1 Tax=Aeromicrobium phragmitis TaxID=2478914 RepID=UPI00105BE5F5
PVSLTSVICKLLERLIKDHMVDFLIKHKLINPSQHGFLKARSCLTNMLCFLEDVTKWVDEGSPVDIIYLDFQKAFDKVPHQRLLLKLKAHGIGEGIINWIEKWLNDRRQRVVVDGEPSNWKSVLSGVPQGSVLGPLLFLVYINDLDDDITSKVLKFADDTKVFRKVKHDGDKQRLQDDLDKLIKWSEKWQMLFNFGKCKCLHTGHGNKDVHYKMGGTVLSTTTTEKDLGVIISADMKVSEQCGIAASKGNQMLGLIRRNIAYKEKELIIPLYKAIVRPHLEYCIQAWRPYHKKDIDMLERVQRRATKMITGLRDRSYMERLKECGLTTLETRRLRGDQIEVFKILNGYENIDRSIFFSIKKDRRTRGHEVTLVKDQCRLDIRKYSFSQRTINEWNRLSIDCVGANSVNMFKNNIDKYLRRAGYT